VLGQLESPITHLGPNLSRQLLFSGQVGYYWVALGRKWVANTGVRRKWVANRSKYGLDNCKVGLAFEIPHYWGSEEVG
jgi:hypothetical protein